MSDSEQHEARLARLSTDDVGLAIRICNYLIVLIVVVTLAAVVL